MSQPAKRVAMGKRNEQVTATAVPSSQSPQGPSGADDLVVQKAKENKGATPEEQEESLFSHLPEHEQAVLKQQLNSPKVNITFFSLYRYASKFEITILVISAVCACAAGAALPLFTVGYSRMSN